MPPSLASRLSRKAPKAFLWHHNHPFRKTHDIGELAQSSGAPAFAVDPAPAGRTPHRVGVGVRYPGEPAEPEADEVRGALLLATEVVEALAAAIEA